jgi:cell division protein FtsN
VVQLGAYDSEAAAEQAWARMRLHGAPHRIEKARVHGRIFYRLRVQPKAGGCRAVARHGHGCFQVRS